LGRFGSTTLRQPRPAVPPRWDDGEFVTIRRCSTPYYGRRYYRRDRDGPPRFYRSWDRPRYRERFDDSWDDSSRPAPFRDWAAEMTNFPYEICEAALPHWVGREVERDYRRSDQFERRRALRDAWAAYCGRPRRATRWRSSGANRRPINGSRIKYCAQD
jgi:hypothetical protein